MTLRNHTLDHVQLSKDPVNGEVTLSNRWRARCERDVELSALVSIRISTQDVPVINKDVKMTFTGAVANLGTE